MLITCPSCASHYAVDPDRIGEGGRRVRCATCRESWLLRPPARKPDLSVVDDVAPRAHPGNLPPRQPNAAEPLVIEAESRPAGPARPKPAGRRVSRRGGPRAGKPRHLAAVAALLVLTVGIPAAVAGRSAVVALLPGTAALYAAAGLPVNLLGLGLESIASTLSFETGAPVLDVSGIITNLDGRSRPVPSISVTIASAAGEPLYDWSVRPSERELAPGASVPFVARLASPPPAGRRVEVGFKQTDLQGMVALR